MIYGRECSSFSYHTTNIFFLILWAKLLKQKTLISQQNSFFIDYFEQLVICTLICERTFRKNREKNVFKLATKVFLNIAMKTRQKKIQRKMKKNKSSKINALDVTYQKLQFQYFLRVSNPAIIDAHPPDQWGNER